MPGLRDLAPDEFQRMVAGLRGEPLPPPVSRPGELPPTVDPQTRSAISLVNEAIAHAMANLQTQSETELGMRPGVPLDIETGLPSSTRAKLSFDDDVINQFQLLTRQYGAGNVERINNRFVIRNQIDPQTGKITDFLANPPGLEGGDIAGMTGSLLPIAGGVLGARAGGRIGATPARRFLSGLGGMALGTEATAFAQQEVTRLLEGTDLKPGDLARERTVSAAQDMVLGAALAGGAKVATKLGQAALGAVGIRTGETATEAAVKALERSTGVKYPLTPGEAAESPLAIRVEATAKPRFGSVGVLGAIEESKTKAEDELRRVFLGLPRSLSDDELAAALPKADITGQQVLGRLGTEALRLEGGVVKARGAVEAAGTQEAQALAGVNLSQPLASREVGSALRTKMQTELASHSSRFGALYESFFDAPETTAKTFSGAPLARAVETIEKKLTPSVLRSKEVKTGLVDESGAPLTTTREVEERLDAFIEGPVKRVIDTLKSLSTGKVSSADLKSIRTSIDRIIGDGESIPGVDIKQLREIRGTITDAIGQSLNEAGGPALFNRWKQINDAFAKSRSRFDPDSISRMNIPPGASGYLGDAELARSVISGKGALDRYTEFKTFFGTASPEFQNVQRLAREQILQGGIAEETGYINGQRLRASLRSLDPEVARDLFGTTKEELHRIGEALSVAQGNLDLAQLRKLASSGSLTAKEIPALEAAERERVQAWGNKLIKAAAKGSEIGEEVIQPSEVVRNLTQMDPDQAQKVLGILSDRPALLEDVRRLAVEDLWARVQSQIKGRVGVTATQINKALGSEVQQRTWKTLLGPKVVEDLQTLSTVVKPQELGTQVFGRAGSMGATTDVTRAEKGGITQVLTESVERWLLGVLYTGPLKRSMLNLMASTDQGRVLNALLVSTPIIDQVAEKFGPDAPQVMSYLRSVVEPKQAKELQIQGKTQGGAPLDLRALSPEEFNRYIERARQ
jgi:hypothetical protein